MEKIQELTDKIYREGVEKGQAEAQRLIKEAEEKAAKIVAEAQEQANEVIVEAEKKAQELEANTKSELKLYAGQALNALKSETVNVVSGKLVKEAVDGLMKDKEFLGNFMVTLARRWSVDEPVVISTSEAEALKKYFTANAKALLDKGVKIEKINGKASSFCISPADGAYKVNFGEEEFAAYFKDFLRPQLIEMLF